MKMENYMNTVINKNNKIFFVYFIIFFSNNVIMDNEIQTIFDCIGINAKSINDINGKIILRDTLLDDKKYEEIKKLIPGLKKIYSSSLLNSLQKNAEQTQKWPLLNLVRQILNNHGYKMEPFRKADGYTLDGIKKYKRFFVITHKVEK